MTRRLLLSVLTGQPILTQSSASIVFLGLPVRRSTNSFGDAEATRTIAGKDQNDNACGIVLQDGRYYWSTRDSREMVKNVSGEFVTFTAMDGSGYVKIAKALKEGSINYLEHTHFTLVTITYWGKTSLFSE